MKIERTKNASKNIRTGLVLKGYQMLLPFFMRTAMLYLMGAQYVGLNSLFYSILHILNLAELGVGSAMVFAMYKPIAEDDEQTICALMRLYRLYYRLIGVVVGVIGLLLTPLIPNLIKGDIPSELNIYVLYWLNLGATVLSYWLFAYKNSLFNAHQRNDVISVVTMITTTVQYAVQLCILLLWKNYYLYLITALATQAMNNVITAIVANKMYPNYKPVGKLSKQETGKINRRIRDLFTGKIGSAVLNSADSVVISTFLGLTVLTVYQNYFFIMSSVIGVLEIILQSVMAGLGNSYVTETKQKNFNDLKKFNFMFMWLAGVCACCLLGLYQPFMELWVGEELMLSFGLVIAFVVYFLVYVQNRLLNAYKDAAGLWHKDRFRPLITAAVNLGMNLLLVNWCGLYGVLYSTVFSMIAVGMPWLLHNLFTDFFSKDLLKAYLKQLLPMLGVVAGTVGVVYLVCCLVQGNLWIVLTVRAAICLIVPNLLFFALLRRSEQFAPSVQLMDRLTKNKLKLEKIFLRSGDR